VIPRPSDRLERFAFAVVFILLGAAAYAGISEIVTPEPKPVIRTIVLDVPPACLDAIDSALAERAHTDTEAQHDTLADERAADLSAAALTLDADVIEAAARDLDAELRLAQQAELDAAAAAAAFDEAAAKCLPEMDR